jgi:hypothetical protein
VFFVIFRKVIQQLSKPYRKIVIAEQLVNLLINIRLGVQQGVELVADAFSGGYL